MNKRCMKWQFLMLILYEIVHCSSAGRGMMTYTEQKGEKSYSLDPSWVVNSDFNGGELHSSSMLHPFSQLHPSTWDETSKSSYYNRDGAVHDAEYDEYSGCV